MKKLALIFISILFLNGVIAQTIIPIPIVVDNSAPRSTNLPLNQLIEFSEKHDCNLSPYSKWSLNEFRCEQGLSGEYYLKINGDGNIIERDYNKVYQISGFYIFLVFIIFMFVILYIFLYALRYARGLGV